MNAKKCFIVAAALNTLLLAFAASFSHQSTRETQRPANELTKRALTGPSGKFGPVIETVLPAAKAQGPANIVEILDLETANALHQPSFEHSNSRVEAEAIMRWIRSNGLDISCFLLSNGAACVSYDMTIVPVEGKYWEKTTEQELLGNPALTPISHSP